MAAKSGSTPSRCPKPSSIAARGRSGQCQRTLYSFMDPKPKNTQTPPQRLPIASSSPCVKAATVSSTAERDIHAGEKRKKAAEVLDLTSDEEDPPLKRRKLLVDSSSTHSYQVSKIGKSSVAKHFASGSPRKWTIPNLTAATPPSGPKAYPQYPGVSDPRSLFLRDARGRSDEPSTNLLLSDGPHTSLPEGDHGMDSFGVDMEPDVVPCSQAQDKLPFTLPPINAPSTRASPLQVITPSLKPNSLLLPFFTPKSARASQQVVPSSTTPSDLRQSGDVHMERIKAPPIPVFTPCSPSYVVQQSQTDDSLPPSSFPRCALPVVSMIYHLLSL